MIVCDHQALESSAKVGEHHPQVQYWMGFLRAHQLKMEYRKGSGYTNAPFLSRPPVYAAQSDIGGDSRLTPPGEADAYFFGDFRL